MVKIIKKAAKWINLFILITCLVFSRQVQAKDLALSVKANDTIAGYATVFQTSITDPNIEVVFKVKKPNGSIIELPSKTNEMGIAKAEFSGFHTKTAGKFEVSVNASDESHDRALKTDFFVFPGNISIQNSTFSADPGDLPAKESEKSLLKVTLKDEYQNPIENKSVLIVSSRNEDIIEKLAGKEKSDQNGNLFFHLSSKNPGISYLSAIDKSSGKAIRERVKVVFFASDDELLDSGGSNVYAANILNFDKSDLKADIFQSDLNEQFGPIDHFEIDFPVKVKVGSDQNFLKIIAKDQEGKTVKNYTGVVIISIPDDENAVLPGDGKYTFQDADQGERTFDLALIFSKTGKQTIQVFDFDAENGTISQSIKGEKVIEVIDQDPLSGTTVGISEEIEIKKPQNGYKTGSSSITLIGKARPNTNLGVFIDEIKITEVEVDADGLFTKEIQNLSDGNHELFVRESEGAGESSEVIDFSIDSNAPILDEFTLFPQKDLYPGDTLTITARSEPDLEKVIVRFAGTLENLPQSPIEKGKYELTLPVPDNLGEHNVSLVMEDQFQNKFEKNQAAILKIIAKPVKNFPIINNLKINALKNSVALDWDKIENSGNATKIIVFQGLDKNALQRVKELDLEKNSIVINNLENEQEYFFALSTADLEDEGSKSEIVSAMPKQMHASAREFFATGGSGKVFLRWTAMEGIDFFEIRLSVDGVNFLESRRVTGSSSNAVIVDLINGQNYFFRLLPNGLEDPLFKTVSAIPVWDGLRGNITPTIVENFSIPENVNNGPLQKNLIFSAIVLTIAFLFFRKAFFLFKT